jgi:predicted  nucleic acid-binding Zn-ribbon protein/outer membrane murein-binding lipoprotein Lpp
VKNLSKEVVRHFLPFVVPAEDRKEAFTNEMEEAAVFCLAESDRDKGGGVIFKRRPEELTFLAEEYYPLWLVPWIRKTLIFDGFGLTTRTLSYNVLPDIQVFVNEAKGSSKTREAFSAFLSGHVNYFQNFAGKEEKTLEGLITSSDFIQSLVSYIPKAEAVKEPIVGKIILSPTINEDEISSSLQELTSLKTALEEDIKSLHKAMKLVSELTKKQVKDLHMIIKATKEDFDKKIAAVEPSVLEETHKIQGKYDKEITDVSRKFEQQLQALHQERVKAEQSSRRVSAEIDRFEAERKACRLRKDETGELHWKQEIEEHKTELSTLEKNINNLDEKIEEADAAKTLEISKLRTEYAAKVEAAKEGLRELEASREAEVRLIEQEIEKLESSSSTIVDQIHKLLELKKASLNEFDGIGIAEKQRGCTLVYLPFYVACYQRELKKRYVVYPPSIVGGMGVLTRLKGIFGAAKIKSLLQQRSKSITNLLNQVTTLTSQNPVFEKEIDDAGIRANILRTKESCLRIEKGLGELRNEGWLSENELQMFSESLRKP